MLLLPINLIRTDFEITKTINEAYFKSLSDDYYFERNLNKNNDQSSAELFSAIKTVVIVCPACMTGGPESLCQIADELKKTGFDVYMLWLCKDNVACKKNINGLWYLCGSETDFAPLSYKNDYDIFYLDKNVILDSSTLIIVPEIWCDYLPFFEGAKKMIAWLSITNVHASHQSNTVRKLIDQKSLYLMDCIHVVNGPWVQKTLEAWGAKPYVVNTYINLRYLHPQQGIKVNNTIAYNPSKGKKLGRSFISKYPNYDYISLKRLDTLGMINALDRAKIYIDFGNFPGRERIPREALLRDCVIFIHNVGCATDYDSFPIEDYFRFSDKDVLNGTLEQKIHETLSCWDVMHNRQATMRNGLKEAEEKFRYSVKKLVGSL